MTVRVLMIEDDEDDYLLTLDCIESIEEASYDVDWVSDGMAAADGAISFDGYDVVLCDYRVGGVTGVQIVEAAIGRGVDAPFILLTGLGDREIDFAAMQAGAVDHLVKDKITPETLEKAIRYAMNAAEAARALKQQSEILNAAMQATDVGMAAIEADGGIAIYNQRIADLLAAPGADEDAVKAAIQAVAAEERLGEGRPIELAGHDGAHAIEVRLNRLAGGGATLACYDVTKHKEIEDALREAKDEAERLSMAKSMFIARLSHEMRTPLHAVIGFGEMLPVAAKDEIEEYSGIIVHSSRGLVSKIDQMLELSRMDLGKVRDDRRALPAEAILREAMAQAAKSQPGLTGRLNIIDGTKAIDVFGDHKLLAKATAEFICNAAKYGHTAQPIEVGANQLSDGRSELWVKNVAAPGAPLLQDDPFESFGQSDQRLERSHEGLGVGLTYVRAVSRLHDGAASLRADGDATIATISLPAGAARPKAEAAA